ncbi:MAG: S-layer homology domain-containing protein [Oscillospiraceae bacterium]|nr:S-layer homology domain-containing protein [Oscillospiraceae bacterium]
MQKFTKRAITILLAIIMIIGIASPAFATRHNFNDVRDGQWYSEGIQFVFANGIMEGVGNNQFATERNLTRSEVSALIFRLHHGRRANASDSTSNNFTDVGSAWYTAYITWMNNNNIDNGTGNQFFPNRHATRQEFATMMYRYAMNMTDLTDTGQQSQQWNQFTDRGQIASGSYSALRWMNFHDVIRGRTTTTINATGTLTRAEAATIFMRFMNVGNGGNNADIDALTRNGATWYQLRNQGFTRVEIQGAFEREFIRLVNVVRAEHGLPAFIFNETVSSVAQARAEESLRHNSWSHVSETTGFSHWYHFRTVTGSGSNVWAVENLAGGQNAAQAVLNAWLASPSHRGLIFSGQQGASWGLDMNQVGIGFDMDWNRQGNHNYTRWTMWLSNI